MRSTSSDDVFLMRPYEDVGNLRKAIEELKEQVAKDGKEREEIEEIRKENWALKERLGHLEK